VKQVVSGKDVHEPSEILDRKVAAFSYFYDRALDNGIIETGQTEARATIESFVDAAKQVPILPKYL
jgi:hypothetical protein